MTDANTLYAEMQSALESIGMRYVARYRWDRDEVLSEINLIFTKAVASYAASGKQRDIQNWITYKVMRGMQALFTKKKRDYRLRKTVSLSVFSADALEARTDAPEFDYDERAKDLPESAKLVLDTLYRDPDFAEILDANAGASRPEIKRLLIAYMREKYGMSYARYWKARAAIRGAFIAA